MTRALLLAALLSTPALAADEWLGEDKALHFSMSAGLAIAGFWVAEAAGTPDLGRYVLGGGYALSLGIVKELADHMGGGSASWRDFGADALGVAVGLGLVWAVESMLRWRPALVAQ